ncbi:MAG TPA: hypothetical protein VGO71_12050 [Baekduia sp.]|jgi:hypothetical protein|nr:hypothetical protein [Baekduia sp.]
MNELEERAQRWIEAIHPHALHLVRARDWVLVIDPDAGEALRIAAVLHDVERAFPDASSTWDPAADWNDPGYVRWHQDRCAEYAVAWLVEQGASPSLVGEVERLILVHEEGGWYDADVLQAADSLSFLETLTSITLGWVRRGIDPEHARAKLQFMADRITIETARAEAEPLLQRALQELGTVAAESPGR